MPEQDVLVDRDIDNLRLTVPLSSVRATVQGTLRLDGIGPLPSLVEVHLANPERPIDGWVFVGDSLSIPLVPLGEYAVRLGPLPQGYSLKAMTAGSVDLLSGKLKVTPSGLAPIVVTLRVASPLPGVRIEGRISNRGESRLPIQIRISGVVPGLTLAAPILEDGSFSWPLVPAGNYRVEFVPPVDSAERTMSVGQRNPASIEVPLRLSNFRSVSVTVVRPPSIVDPPPPVRALRPVLRNVERPNDLILAGQTADGTFEFLNVEPGTYQVLLSEPGPRGANVLSNPVVPIVVADKDITGVQIFVP
jgi:hypothetical protein